MIVLGAQALADGPPQSDPFRDGIASYWQTFQIHEESVSLPPPMAEVREGSLTLTSADGNSGFHSKVWRPFLVSQAGITGDFTMQVKILSLPDCFDSGAGLFVMASPSANDSASGDPVRWTVEALHQGNARSEGGVEGKLIGHRFGANLQMPYWIRLDRRGDTVTGFYSTDGGKTWQVEGDPVDLAKAGLPSLTDPLMAGILQETNCEATPGTAVVTQFQEGRIGLAGLLPGDSNGTSEGRDGTFQVRESESVPGGVATVEIVADEQVTALAGAILTLKFDPALALTEDDVEAGPLILPPYYSNVQSGTGKVTLALLSRKNAHGPGVLARLRFHLPPNVPVGTVFPIIIAGVQATNAAAETLNVGYKSGSIQVIPPPLSRDLNGDGKVNFQDAILSLRLLGDVERRQRNSTLRDTSAATAR